MTNNAIFHPRAHVVDFPEKPAVIAPATGDILTYAELEVSANRYAHLLRRHGLRQGDVVAVLLGNDPVYLALAWAAQRSGVYFVGISTKLTPAEIACIVSDSGAGLLLSCREFAGPDLAALLSFVTILHVEDDPASDLPEAPVDDE